MPAWIADTAGFVVHHRSDLFRSEFSSVRQGLKQLFRTEGEVAVLAASGTGAMEAAVANIVSAGDRVVVVRSGKYGERWGELCGVYGAVVDWLDVEPGNVVDPERIDDRLAQGNIRAVFLVHCETSTGALNDLEAVGRVAGGRATVVADVISSLCVHPLEMDRWGVDLAVGASQKGLALPPGLGFVAVGPGAVALVNASTSPRYYLDLRKYLSSAEADETPFTAPVTQIAALGRVLREPGFPGESVARHTRIGRAVRAGVRAMGLEIFPVSPSNGVTVFRVPESLNADRLVRTLEDELGVRIAHGQGALKGRVLRLGHLGRLEDGDVIRLFEALEEGLSRCGCRVEHGRGLGAVRRMLANVRVEDRHGS